MTSPDGIRSPNVSLGTLAEVLGNIDLGGGRKKTGRSSITSLAVALSPYIGGGGGGGGGGSTALQAEIDALTNSLAQQSARVFLPRQKPGESPNDFTSSLAGAPDTLIGLDPAGATTTAAGKAYSVTGAGTIATRTAFWLEPNRVYALRALFSRLANPTDPSGDTVRVLIEWLDASYAAISQTIVQDVNLNIVTGLHTTSARVPSQSGDPVTITPPAGTVYWRPAVVTFGADGVTLIAAIAVADITTATVFSPDLTATNSRVTTLETEFAAFSPLSPGTPGGYATLDANGQLPAAQLKLSRAGESHITAPLVTRARNWRWITDADNITGNGTSDDTTATQAQVTAAIAAEQTLLIPDGCILRLTAPMVVSNSGGRLRVSGCRPPPVRNVSYPGQGPSPTPLGSFFFLDHLGIGFSFQGASNDPVYANAEQEFHGSAFRGVGTRRNQPATTGSTFVPVAADYDFVVSGARVWFEDTVSPNPTKWLHCTNHGLINVKGFRGQPLTEWMSIDHSFDCNWFDDNECWPYWSLDQAVMDWQHANLTFWKLGRVDNIKSGRFFGLGCNRGMFIYANTDSDAGTANSVNRGWFDLMEFDSCKTAIVFDGSISAGATMHFNTLGSFHDTPLDGTGAADNTVTMFGSNSVVTIGHFEPGVSRGSYWVIDGSGSNNKVRINKMVEFIHGMATVASSYGLRVIGNNSIQVDDYVKRQGYSPSTGRCNGRVRVVLGEGFETTTVDSSGAVTLAHNCGPDHPSYIDVAIRGGAVQHRVETDPDALHCKITFFNSSGTALASGAPVSFKWKAGFDYPSAGDY